MATNIIVKPKALAEGAKRMGFEKLGLTRSPGTKKTIRVSGDKINGYNINLTDKMLNPWFKSKEETPEEQERITKRDYFQRKLGGGVDLGNKSSFWEDFKVTLVDGLNYFNIEDPVKELQVEVLKSSIEVANSPNELHKFPKATYVIYDEIEELEKKAKKAELQIEATTLLSELTPELRMDVCRILGKNVDNFKPSLTFSTLYEFITTSPKGAERFLEVCNMDKGKIKVESLIREALVVDALRNYGGRIVRVDGNQDGDVIGIGIEKAVEFLMLKKNVLIREAIESEIKAKRATKAGINY